MANYQLTSTFKAPWTLAENDGKAATGDVISVVSGDPSSVSISVDTTPGAGFIATGTMTGDAKLAASVLNVAVTATVTHADGTSSTTTQFVDVIVVPPALTLAFGTAVPQ